MERPRRPAVQLLVSAVAPGIGSFANGEPGRGAAILAGWVALVAGLIGAAGADPAQPLTIAVFVVCLYGLPALWVYNLVTAWRGAGRANRREGFPG